MAVDLTTVLQNAYYGLMAKTAAELDQWTADQLWRWMDDELRRLALKYQLFGDRTDTMAIGAGQYIVPLGEFHAATIEADWNSVPLRAATTQELDAQDADWEETQGPPTRFVRDWNDAQTLRLYPIPTQAGTLGVVFLAEPPHVSAAATQVGLPQVEADVLALRAIAEARRVETDSQMPEAVSWCEGMIALYEQAFAAYHGGGA